MNFMSYKIEDFLMENPTDEYNNLILKMNNIMDEILYKNLSDEYKEILNIESGYNSDKKLLAYYFNHEKYYSNKIILSILSIIFLVLSIVCLAFIISGMFRGVNTNIIFLFIQFALIFLGIITCLRLNFYLKLDFLNYIDAFVYSINNNVFANNDAVAELIDQILEEIKNNKGG